MIAGIYIDTPLLNLEIKSFIKVIMRTCFIIMEAVYCLMKKDNL